MMCLTIDQKIMIDLIFISIIAISLIYLNLYERKEFTYKDED